MRKRYKKEERKYAKKFLINNPIILEKVRCYLDAPELDDKDIRKIMKKILAIMDEIDLSDIIDGYVDHKSYCIQLSDDDYDYDYDSRRKKEKFDLESYMDSF